MSVVCPICFDELENKSRATPDICDHIFCLPCLQKWSKHQTFCPIDRKKFKKIINLDAETAIKVKPRKRKYARAVYDISVYCEICKNANNADTLLLCDSCDLGYHCECLSPPVRNIPKRRWDCPECVTISDRISSNRTTSTDNKDAKNVQKIKRKYNRKITSERNVTLKSQRKVASTTLKKIRNCFQKNISEENAGFSQSNNPSTSFFPQDYDMPGPSTATPSANSCSLDDVDFDLEDMDLDFSSSNASTAGENNRVHQEQNGTSYPKDGEYYSISDSDFDSSSSEDKLKTENGTSYPKDGEYYYISDSDFDSSSSEDKIKTESIKEQVSSDGSSVDFNFQDYEFEFSSGNEDNNDRTGKADSKTKQSGVPVHQSGSNDEEIFSHINDVDFESSSSTASDNLKLDVIEREYHKELSSNIDNGNLIQNETCSDLNDSSVKSTRNVLLDQVFLNKCSESCSEESKNAMKGKSETKEYEQGIQNKCMSNIIGNTSKNCGIGSIIKSADSFHHDITDKSFDTSSEDIQKSVEIVTKCDKILDMEIQDTAMEDFTTSGDIEKAKRCAIKIVSVQNEKDSNSTKDSGCSFASKSKNNLNDSTYKNCENGNIASSKDNLDHETLEETSHFETSLEDSQKVENVTISKENVTKSKENVHQKIQNTASKYTFEGTENVRLKINKVDSEQKVQDNSSLDCGFTTKRKRLKSLKTKIGLVQKVRDTFEDNSSTDSSDSSFATKRINSNKNVKNDIDLVEKEQSYSEDNSSDSSSGCGFTIIRRSSNESLQSKLDSVQKVQDSSEGSSGSSSCNIAKKHINSIRNVKNNIDFVEKEEKNSEDSSSGCGLAIIRRSSNESLQSKLNSVQKVQDNSEDNSSSVGSSCSIATYCINSIKNLINNIDLVEKEQNNSEDSSSGCGLAIIRRSTNESLQSKLNSFQKVQDNSEDNSSSVGSSCSIATKCINSNKNVKNNIDLVEKEQNNSEDSSSNSSSGCGLDIIHRSSNESLQSKLDSVQKVQDISADNSSSGSSSCSIATKLISSNKGLKSNIDLVQKEKNNSDDNSSNNSSSCSYADYPEAIVLKLPLRLSFNKSIKSSGDAASSTTQASQSEVIENLSDISANFCRIESVESCQDSVFQSSDKESVMPSNDNLHFNFATKTNQPGDTFEINTDKKVNVENISVKKYSPDTTQITFSLIEKQNGNFSLTQQKYFYSDLGNNSYNTIDSAQPHCPSRNTLIFTENSSIKENNASSPSKSFRQSTKSVKSIPANIKDINQLSVRDDGALFINWMNTKRNLM